MHLGTAFFCASVHACRLCCLPQIQWAYLALSRKHYTHGLDSDLGYEEDRERNKGTIHIRCRHIMTLIGLQTLRKLWPSKRSVNLENIFWNSQFFQKMNETWERIILTLLEYFFQILRSFFGRVDNSKNCFWDLLTLSKVTAKRKQERLQFSTSS